VNERLHCPVARECGGCALIDRSYDEQLQAKTDRVREAFAARPDLAADLVEPCLPAPERAAYRNRAKLAVAFQEGALRIGLHARGSQRVVDLGQCRVQRPNLKLALDRVRHWLGRYRLARPAGPVIYLDLREATEDRCHLTLVLDGDRTPLERLPLRKLADALPVLSGIAVNFGDAGSSYPMGPVTRTVMGPATFPAPLLCAGGETVVFDVPPAGFFQVAAAAMAEVHRRMAAHLGNEGRLYALYCGVGVHGLMVEGEAGAKSPGIVGIEASEEQVEAAQGNARRFGVPARYVTGKVEEMLSGLVGEQPPSRVVLNPGRSGCRPDVVESLARSGAVRVAYLSCNPVTLARDLVGLLAGGFRLERVTPVDLMPQTDQVEVLALIRR